MPGRLSGWRHLTSSCPLNGICSGQAVLCCCHCRAQLRMILLVVDDNTALGRERGRFLASLLNFFQQQHQHQQNQQNQQHHQAAPYFDSIGQVVVITQAQWDAGNLSSIELHGLAQHQGELMLLASCCQLLKSKAFVSATHQHQWPSAGKVLLPACMHACMLGSITAACLAIAVARSMAPYHCPARPCRPAHAHPHPGERCGQVHRPTRPPSPGEPTGPAASAKQHHWRPALACAVLMRI